ncbi:hypothetical protein HUT06_23055 [Actinomadura sp. NAK00032]|uniref:hypothetical protein n=1 Tax=Actinomadura sp. NAK00032 TaxID=2742128 RepID=UPI00159144F0|nr:hypothetical protein [Actinomadura sp. NAK00032]QKW36539.1 hypothetical protein HUT06_23055 [Actinomadura sp. NAK00032]
MDVPLTLAELLPNVGAITVPTGAVVSTGSGIPDLRGPHGAWTRQPAAEAMSTTGSYLADPPVPLDPAVRPAAGPCAEALDTGARPVIINAGPTPYDGLADAVLRRPIGETPPRLAGLALGTGR